MNQLNCAEPITTRWGGLAWASQVQYEQMPSWPNGVSVIKHTLQTLLVAATSATTTVTCRPDAFTWTSLWFHLHTTTVDLENLVVKNVT